MNLKAMMARHARRVLVRLDHYGETVTYTPVGGVAVQVQAVVERKDVEPLDEQISAVGRLLCQVFIARDAAVGVLAVAPGDTMTLALRMGAEPVAARVTRILSQDEGGFLIEVAA